MKRFWQISIIGSLVFAISMNVAIGLELLGLSGIDEISDTYATLLTPADYAFSIWSLIYILLTIFVIYQARDFFSSNKNNDLPQTVGLLFVTANIANGLWTLVFASEKIGLSVIILLVLTGALYGIIWKLRIALDDVEIKTIAFVWWPLLVYTGWVSVATIVNIASWLQALGIEISEVVASLILLFLSGGLLAILIKRNVRELLLASSWGIAAIGFRQSEMNNGSQIVAVSAFCLTGVLLLAVVMHAYHNRDKNILKKLPFIVRSVK